MTGKNYVSGSVRRIRKRLQEADGVTEAFKKTAKDIVTYGIDDFEQRLRTGEVKVNSIADFERLVKLGLLLYGEATEKIETATSDTEEIEIYEDITNTEEYEKIVEMLSERMNEKNENA